MATGQALEDCRGCPLVSRNSALLDIFTLLSSISAFSSSSNSASISASWWSSNLNHPDPELLHGPRQCLTGKHCQCTVLYCSVLFCTVLYFTVLYLVDRGLSPWHLEPGLQVTVLVCSPNPQWVEQGDQGLECHPELPPFTGLSPHTFNTRKKL